MGTLMKASPPEPFLAIATMLDCSLHPNQEVSIYASQDGVSVNIIDKMGVRHFYTIVNGEWYTEVKI